MVKFLTIQMVKHLTQGQTLRDQTQAEQLQPQQMTIGHLTYSGVQLSLQGQHNLLEHQKALGHLKRKDRMSR